jgi:hypothetical protein
LVELLDRARLPVDRLAVELTEESVIREPEAAVEALQKLRSLGIELLALDDFGTGYSSTGLAQCSELTWQLRGTAGARQIEGARAALQHSIGLGGAAVVTVYRRP